MTLATQDEVIEPEIVRTHTEWAEVIKSDLGRAVEGIVSAGKHLTAAKADVEHTQWMPMLKEIGIDDSTARRLMSIARNPAISNRGNCHDFPTAMRALYELSRMEPSDIEDGIEAGHVTPDMRIKDAKAFANNEWPDVPEPDNYTEPTPEERFQQMEAARNQLIADGIRPAPLTDEERATEAREFVESIIGNTDAATAIEFGDDQGKPIVTPNGHTIRSGENEYTDAANGIRNDVQARTNMLLDYLGAVGKNLPGDNLPDYANDHVIQALKNNMEDIQNAFEWTLKQIERS